MRHAIAYLIHRPTAMRYLVEVEYLDVFADPLEFKVQVQSATPGRSFPKVETVTCRPNPVKTKPLSDYLDFAAGRLFGDGVRLLSEVDTDKNNWYLDEYNRGAIFIDQAIRELILKHGFELALSRIEDEQEPEAVALCGGLQYTLEVMNDWKRRIDEYGYGAI